VFVDPLEEAGPAGEGVVAPLELVHADEVPGEGVEVVGAAVVDEDGQRRGRPLDRDGRGAREGPGLAVDVDGEGRAGPEVDAAALRELVRARDAEAEVAKVEDAVERDDDEPMTKTNFLRYLQLECFRNEFPP